MKEKLQRINEICSLKTEWGFTIKVKILDYKNSYECDRDITDEIQVYDWLGKERVVYCEQCNWRLGKVTERVRRCKITI